MQAELQQLQADISMQHALAEKKPKLFVWSKALLHSGLEVRKETERVWVVRNTFIEADEEEPTLPRKKSLENHGP